MKEKEKGDEKVYFSKNEGKHISLLIIVEKILKQLLKKVET